MGERLLCFDKDAKEMIREQPHKSYQKRVVFLLRTISNTYGLMIKAATRATIVRSSERGLTLHCKCKECGSHYTIDRVPHADVLLASEKDKTT